MAATLNGAEDSFSSDSDDEFLTVRDDGKKTMDREALIRKKLLESFYGKSGDGGDQAASAGSDDSDSDSDDGSAERKGGKKVTSEETENLDSPHFNALAHTRRHVLGSTVHQLLEIEEGLACQVRTLDSSMQTLVYENYSRFIDGTDAIRSIGVNVEANEKGLKRLSKGMHTISETSKAIEDNLGELRDNVVEKLRVKRLLQRLDTLLKLPRTLNEHIRVSKYRLAAKSYLQAYSILSKQSAGFESLQRIEMECESILNRMVADLRRKLLHWSGHQHLLVDDDENETAASERGEQQYFPPNPPKSIAEIFECAGTPILLSGFGATSEKPSSANFEAGDGGETPTVAARIEVDLSAEQCKEMALAASLRQFERILDTHHIELQEAKLGGSPLTMDLDDDRSGGNGNSEMASQKLIPINFLESILEAASLFGANFANAEGDIVGEDHQRLSQFVSEAFDSFLMHCRAELLEQSMTQNTSSSYDGYGLKSDEPVRGNEEDQAKIEEEDERAHEEIAAALSLLVAAVKQLATGLALPQIGIDDELTSDLVKKAIGLTETMVRRRVDQKFYALRLRVVTDCLSPFCQKATAPSEVESSQHISSRVLQVVQMASVALSDALQLVDDTVRSILAGTTDGAESNADMSMLKPAVEASTKKFAAWLACAIEMLAGCESGDPRFLVEAKQESPEGADSSARKVGSPESISHISLYRDDVSEYSNDGQTESVDMADDALFNLVEKLESSDMKDIRSDVTLALAEMSRVAERSVTENIDQCIATHSGEGKQRKSKSMFPHDGKSDEAHKPNSKSSNPMKNRFQLAASRVLGVYSIDRGYEAAGFLCADLCQQTDDDSESMDVSGPSEKTIQVLELIKEVSYDCADIFGGSKRAGPIAEQLEDQYTMPGSSGARSGLGFDVERMFAEKIDIYPHPNEISQFTRNSVVTTAFKVAFKSLAEKLRLCRLSHSGYRQLLVDCEFFKFMLPHYVKDEFMAEGYNALAVLECLLTEAKETGLKVCNDKESLLADDTDEIVNDARSKIRDFMDMYGGVDGKMSRFTIPE